MGGYVYILASQPNGTLYVGVTSDIERRMHEHRSGTFTGFTKTYGVKLLVHLEIFDRIEDAIAREKQLKRWNREWKINLIERDNRRWYDLAATWFAEPEQSSCSGVGPRLRGDDD